MDPKQPLPRCECGEASGLYHSKRLGRFVCPICLDRDVAELLQVLESLTVLFDKVVKKFSN